MAYEETFRSDAPDSDRAGIRRHSLGNSLFVNGADDGPGFQETADEAGVRMGRWGWGAVFADWNNDAQADLVVPNGFVTGPIEDDL